jgi:hypothetical protein
MSFQGWPAEALDFYDGPWLETSAPKQRVTDFLNASQPLCHWLRANVGPAAGPER